MATKRAIDDLSLDLQDVISLEPGERKDSQSFVTGVKKRLKQIQASAPTLPESLLKDLAHTTAVELQSQHTTAVELQSQSRDLLEGTGLGVDVVVMANHPSTEQS